MPDLPPVPPDIVRVAAPLLLGGLLNWCLYGVLLVQVYVYSYNFPNDGKRTKLLVYGIFSLVTVQTVLNGADLFYWFASGYGNLNDLFNPFLSPYEGPILESLVSAIVQFFYSYRIWVITNKQFWWLCLFICLSSTINLAAGIAGGIYLRIHERFPTGPQLRRIAITWMVGNVMADLLVTSTMVYHITKLRRASNCSFGGNALVKIVRLTIETNLLTTTVSLTALLVVVIYPNNNWYICPLSILGKIYSNTLLVSLNSRASFREEGTPRVLTQTQTQSIAFVTSHLAPSPTTITWREFEPPEVVYKPSECTAK